MNNQGGSVLIYTLIIVCFLSATGCFVLLTLKASKPSRLSEANAASIRDMGKHISEIQKTLITRGELFAGLESDVEKIAEGLSNTSNIAQANKLEIDNLKKRSDGNDGKLVDRVNLLSERLNAVPRLVDKKLNLFNRSVTVSLTPQKTIGYERVIRKDGKAYKQMIYKSKPIHEDKPEKPEKFKMPGVKEAKDQFVEHRL